MPIYQLPDEIAFPDPSEAEPDGLLAVGGDLCQERLGSSIQPGIFPWFSKMNQYYGVAGSAYGSVSKRFQAIKNSQENCRKKHF